MRTQALPIASILIVALIPLQVTLLAVRNRIRSYLFPMGDGMSRAGAGPRSVRTTALHLSYAIPANHHLEE